MERDPSKVHRDLCGLRYDNRFKFAASKPSGLTTTCFDDVVLEPLATWVLLAVLLPLLAWRLKRRRSTFDVKSSLLHYHSSANPNKTKFSGKPFRWRLALAVLYMLLVLAALLMNILQIVRLALAKRGVGLLPFNLAGILIVLVLLHLRTTDPYAVSMTVLAFWSMLLTFTSVALASLGKLNGVEDRKGTEYLLSDEMIDVGVQVGLYAVFWIVETTRLMQRTLTTRREARGTAILAEHAPHDGAMTTQSEEKVAFAA